jgi:tryptophanyl-tRNA synthetase
MDSKIKTVVSGITPSGNMLHIGNYFGAIKPHLELQESVEQAYYFIADLHALTTVKDKSVLENNIRNVILDYLALGLDPEKVVFFRQSQVESHSELAIILGNYISFGQMQRMHAFKDKLQDGEVVENINMGLFNYPILMAADILLYKPYGVPVGEDQRQHIELARDIAQNFNKTYEIDFFPLPEPMIDKKKEISKVVGTDGVRKMSKSLGNVIGIFDEEETIRKQIMRCFTDPTRIRATDPGKVEGNPVFIFHDLLNDNIEEVQDLKDRYTKGEVGDVEVKEKLFNAHMRYFKNARERRKQLEQDMKSVEAILEKGRAKATEVSMKTVEEVKNLIGLKENL